MTIPNPLLIQQTKHANLQSNDQHNRKINERQTTYDIVNFYLFFQLFVQSFQQVHESLTLNLKDLVLLLAQWIMYANE